MTDPKGETSLHLRRALNGDPRSLTWMVERISPLLRSQAFARLPPTLRTREELDDLVQEAWLSILPKLDGFRLDDGRVTPRLMRFLGTAVVYICNNRIRSSVRRGTRSSDAGDRSSEGAIERHESRDGRIIAAAMHNETAEIVEECLGRLEEADRDVLRLRLLDGCSNQEVAEHLGIDPNAASMRFKRAIPRLKAALPGSIFDDLGEEQGTAGD